MTGLSWIAERLRPLAVEVGTLRHDPRNARKHRKRNLDAVRASLFEHGQVKPIVATPDGTVIAGNGTLEAARALGWTHLAVVTYAGDAESARRYALQDNRTAELAEWDNAALADLLRDLNAESDDALAGLGFSDEEFMKILAEADPPPPDDVDETEGGKIPKAEGASEEPAGGNVRMVNLFLTDVTAPLLAGYAKTLGPKYGTSNLTDTVFEAVRRQHAAETGEG